MKTKLTLRILVLMACALLLSGCFDVTQEVWIYAGGGGKISIDMGIERSFATALTASGSPFGSFSMNSGEASLSEYDSGDMHHFVTTVSYSDLPSLIEALQNDDTGNTQVSFYQAENGNYILRQAINFDEMAADQGLDAASIGMMNSMFEDKYFTLRIHVPNVVNSNGSINRLTNTVEWRIPILDFYTLQSLDMTLEYNHQTGPLGLPILAWLLIGGGLVVILLFVGIMLNLRDRRTSAQEFPTPTTEPQ